MMRRERKRKQHIGRLSILLSGILCISLLLFLPPKEAAAYDAVTELEVTVGYFGADQEYTKAVPSISELQSALGTHQEIYTFLNAGSNPGTIEAEGIYLSDIMEYCGVDMSTVDGYNFFTQDASYQERTKSWTNADLFGERYTFKEVFQRAYDDYVQDPEDYIRNWQAHYTVANFFDFSAGAYNGEAWAVREPVEPMLAISAKSTRWKNTAPGTDLSFSGLSSNGAPILYYGQADVSEQTAATMAQMVYKINIRYEGSPEITVEDTSVDGEAGTQGQVTVHVDTPDETLTEAIKSDIVYTSDNDSVATVDQDGNIVIQGEGAANITVSYGGTVYGSIGATGTKEEDITDPGAEEEPEDTQEDPPKEDEPEEQGQGSGSGNGQGDSGSGGGSGNTNGQGDNAGNDGGGESETGNGTSGDGGSTGLDKSGLSGTQTGGMSSGQGSNLNPSGSSPRFVRPTGGVASGQTTQQTARAAERAGAAGDTGGGNNTVTTPSNQTVYEITPDQEALQAVAETVTNPAIFKRTLLVGLIALIIGVFAESMYYRNQTLWVKRAKRIYEKR